MTPTVASALLAMSTCGNRDTAQHWARAAAARGATPAELALAWAAWDRQADASVHLVDLVVAGQTAARCACSHTRGQHREDRRGRVVCAGPCGCAEFREKP